MNQPKIEKILCLVTILGGSKSLSVEQLAQELKTSERTIYRYMDTLKDSGYVIINDNRGRYKMLHNGKVFKSFKGLLQFSEDEANIISSAFESIVKSKPHMKALFRKLYAIYNTTNIIPGVENVAVSSELQVLSDVIDKKYQVFLRGYSSSSSEMVKDYFVEPFALSRDKSEVWALDLDSMKVKLFKIARIEQIEVKKTKHQYPSLHVTQFQDAFHMTGPDKIHIQIELGRRSRNLLIEEYPLCQKDIYVIGNGDKFLLDTTVCDVRGIGRFLLSVADDVTILKGEQVRQYIKKFSDDYISRL
ncbi:MAG: HTH domain-containing protein [Alistipes sp.]|nr:HTH domain-containing protein [Candidatus Alistipes equi]